MHENVSGRIVGYMIVQFISTYQVMCERFPLYEITEFFRQITKIILDWEDTLAPRARQ